MKAVIAEGGVHCGMKLLRIQEIKRPLIRHLVELVLDHEEALWVGNDRNMEPKAIIVDV
jgi:hypothetical protein